MYKLFVILLITFYHISAEAQVLPTENAALTYRIIGFSFPKNHENKYILEIAGGEYISNKDFAKNIISRVVSHNNKIISEGPSFGSKFTWRIIYPGSDTTKSALHHFSTVMNDRVATNKLHLKILQTTDKSHANYYVSVDAGGVLYDMTGSPVWYIKENDSISGYVADMAFTSRGTITFLYKNGYEINYNGDIIWKTPKTEKTINGYPVGANYHHEFTRLDNGHYMVLGAQPIEYKLETNADTSYIVTNIDKKKEPGDYRSGVFGIITEYDEKGKTIWSWKTSDYLFAADFAYYEARKDSSKQSDPHDNSFFFDEKNKYIYLSFRNLNRIIKISYPGGKVVETYGENYKNDNESVGKGLFCNQHNVNISHDGLMYYFNNNTCCAKDSYPSIVLLKERKLPKESLKKVWEYNCICENRFTKRFASGGNVKELQDQSMFVNMGSAYSNLFIVNRDKKIIWSALPERFMETDQQWIPIREYRANIITEKELEQLIWSTENSK